jgi:cobalt/nickel transport protein
VKLKVTTILAVLLVISFFSLLALTTAIPKAEWGGADSQGMELVEQSLNYEPWANPIWEPPSGEIESLLFALQAAIGSLIIGYYFGILKGRKESEK